MLCLKWRNNFFEILIDALSNPNISCYLPPIFLKSGIQLNYLASIAQGMIVSAERQRKVSEILKAWTFEF